MITSRMKVISLANFAGDISLTVAAFLLAYILRTLPSVQPFFAPKIKDLASHLWLIPVIVFVWAVVFLVSGIYRSPGARTLREQLVLVSATILLGGLLIITLIFLTVDPGYSRSLVLIFLLVDFILLGLKVMAARYLYRYFARWIGTRRVLVVGTLEKAGEFLSVLRKHNWPGVECAGVLSIDDSQKQERGNPVPVIGNASQLTEVLDTMRIDSVVFSVPADRMGELGQAVRRCEEAGTEIYLDLEIGGLQFSKGFAESISGRPLLTFSSTPYGAAAAVVKRILDFAVSLVILVLLSPLLLLSVFLVKLTSRGPVFFVQRRSGLYGRKFGVVKFRTMVQDAEGKKKDVISLNEMSGPVFKVTDDPRLTRIGRFLRKFSIDELPQLFNVLRGHMSLVGPRPLPVEEIRKLPERWQRRRLSMKPGITCLWQISGRNAIDFDEWMKLDLEYIDRWSLKLDLKILLLTVPAVLLARGAS